MKSQTTLILGCVALLTCIVLGYLIMQSGSEPVEEASAQTESQTSPRNADAGATEGVPEGATTRATRSTPREARGDSHLVERFGEARTGLSKKITNDLAAVFDEALEIGNMAATMAGAANMEEAATSQTVAMLARELGMDDEQRELATPIIAAEVARRFDAVRDMASSMRSDPTPIMELFLYGDALARDTITEDEYQSATAGTRTMLEEAGANIMGRRPQSAIPLEGSGDGFASEFADVLTPDQQAELEAMIRSETDTAGSARGRGDLPFQNGVPVMEIERLDETITSARSMTSGMQQMMQGFDSLRQNLED